MIFRQWQQVLGRSKWQTRRLKKEGDYAVYSDYERSIVHSVSDRNHRLRWQVGYTYAIQPPSPTGRGGKAVGRFLLKGIRKERVQDISEEDAIAEGMFKELHLMALKSVTRYMMLWDSIHKKAGTRWEDDPEVWVLEMEVSA